MLFQILISAVVLAAAIPQYIYILNKVEADKEQIHPLDRIGVGVVSVAICFVEFLICFAIYRALHQISLQDILGVAGYIIPPAALGAGYAGRKIYRRAQKRICENRALRKRKLEEIEEAKSKERLIVASKLPEEYKAYSWSNDQNI